MNRETVWLKLLSLMDTINRSVKEPGWLFEDKAELYEMKDSFLLKILNERPDEVKTDLYYVPYLKYSDGTKDKAGELMRRDGKRHSFEYYLGQVEPSEYDKEDLEKALIEIVAECMGQSFSFHIPVQKMPAEYCIKDIPRKKWIAAGEFHHQQFTETKEKYSELINELDEQT